jgi:hypothetical protein
MKGDYWALIVKKNQLTQGLVPTCFYGIFPFKNCVFAAIMLESTEFHMDTW